MARLAQAVESMNRGSGLDVSPALRRQSRPAIRLERLEPDPAELGIGFLELAVAVVCALGFAALWLA